MVLEVNLGHVAEVTVSVAGSEEDKLAALLDRAVDGVLNEVDALLGDEARHTGHQGLARIDGEAEALLQVPDDIIHRKQSKHRSVKCIVNAADFMTMPFLWRIY